LHEVHSEHALLTQQTPSTQKRVLKHGMVLEHAWPGRPRLPHLLVLGSQMVGGTQSASRVQAPRQAVDPLQT
jgi:hypothetical protein